MTKSVAKNEQETIPLKIAGVEPPSQARKTDAGNFFTFIGIPAVIGSMLTAATYLIGVAFQQAYLTYFQVNYGLFPKNSSDYFLFAWQAFFELTSSRLHFSGASFQVLALIVATFAIALLVNKAGNALDKSKRMKRMRTKANSNKAFAIVGEFIFLPAIVIAAIYYALIFLTLLLILPVLIGNTAGKRAAATDMARYEKDCKPVKGNDAFCTQVIDAGAVIAKGFVIETSDKYVALLENGKARVVPIKEREFLPFEN